MKHIIALLTALLLAPLAALHADDSAKLSALLSQSVLHGGVVTIPPSDYALDGKRPLKLSSGMTVFAYGKTWSHRRARACGE